MIADFAWELEKAGVEAILFRLRHVSWRQRSESEQYATVLLGFSGASENSDAFAALRDQKGILLVFVIAVIERHWHYIVDS